MINKLKKRTIIIIAAAAVAFVAIAVVSVLLFLPNGERVDTDGLDSGTLMFIYGGSKEFRKLKSDDLEAIKELFNGQLIYKDVPDCSFTDNVSMTLGSRIFCFACDGCGTVFDKTNGYYFDLSDSEKEELHEILKLYGITFPCT